MAEDDLQQRALDYVMTILSQRAYTEHQLRERIARRFGPHATEIDTDSILDQLREYNLVNDELFAEQYAETYRLRRGPIRIAQELRQRGVAESIIAEALAKLRRTTDFVECAHALITERAWRYQVAEGADFTEFAKAKQRAWGFLARAGYEIETIEIVLERVGWFSNTGRR